MPFVKRPKLLYVGRGQFTVFQPGLYKGKTQDFVIPTKYKTDLASRPKIFRWLLDTYGVYEDCTIVHDINCDEQRNALWEGRKSYITSRDTDGMFRRMMREEGVPPILRWLMWVAVRWGALVSPYRRKTFGYWPDLPIMVGLSLLAAPVVVPVTIVVVLAQLIYTALEFAATVLAREN